MKFYIELDDDRDPFVVDADSAVDAIAKLWERRSEQGRGLGDILPNYRVHIGQKRTAKTVEAWPVYWKLSQGARFIVLNYLWSLLSPETFQNLVILLQEYQTHER